MTALLSSILQALGGPDRISWRRPAYVLTILASADLLCWAGRLTGAEWVAIAMALVGTGVAGEVAPHLTGRRRREPDATSPFTEP